MIDIEKVRVWSVRFVCTPQLKSMPSACMVVEETEGRNYRMPQCAPESIPLDVGGQITITLEGKGILKVGGKKYDCVPGTAFLYHDSNPLVSYYFPPNGSSKWRFVWINFMGEVSSRIIAEINRTYGYFFNIGLESELEKKLLTYRKYAGSTFSQSPLEASMLFFELLDLLLYPAKHQIALSRKEQRIIDINHEIQTAFTESVTTKALARKLGITREHLSRSFRDQTGQTLKESREGQRLNQALTLLMKSNLSCKEIAVLCNYGSYSSFFRSFKKHYKLSPEFFREKQSEANAIQNHDSPSMQ